MTMRALVRPPGPRLADGLVTHIDRSPVDVDLARRQWDAYVAALRNEGWETVEVPRADDCPDAVFVEDTVVVYGDLAVISRPGADERKPETAGTEQTLRELGYRIARIEAPGTLDGGDVLKHGGTVWVGLGGRTNRDGLSQLAAHLAPLGARTVGVPVSRVLHLKSGGCGVRACPRRVLGALEAPSSGGCAGLRHRSSIVPRRGSEWSSCRSVTSRCRVACQRPRAPYGLCSPTSLISPTTGVASGRREPSATRPAGWALAATST